MGHPLLLLLKGSETFSKAMRRLKFNNLITDLSAAQAAKEQFHESWFC
jgi:hypothetical protein